MQMQGGYLKMLLAKVAQVMEILQEDPSKSHMTVPEIKGTVHQLLPSGSTLPFSAIILPPRIVTSSVIAML
jgi:hypothetical protein